MILIWFLCLVIETFTVTDNLEECLITILQDLVYKKKFIEIYIACEGEFDIYVATIVKCVQRDYDDYHTIEFNLILPHPQKDMEDFERYCDRVDIPISAHPKLAITKRNEWMAEQADRVSCYIERESGGAYKAVKYAECLGKQIINLYLVCKKCVEQTFLRITHLDIILRHYIKFLSFCQYIFAFFRFLTLCCKEI